MIRFFRFSPSRLALASIALSVLALDNLTAWPAEVPDTPGGYGLVVDLGAMVTVLMMGAIIGWLIHRLFVSEVRASESLHRTETYLAEAQRLSLTGSFGWNVSSGEI